MNSQVLIPAATSFICTLKINYSSSKRTNTNFIQEVPTSFGDGCPVKRLLSALTQPGDNFLKNLIWRGRSPS